MGKQNFQHKNMAINIEKKNLFTNHNVYRCRYHDDRQLGYHRLKYNDLIMD